VDQLSISGFKWLLSFPPGRVLSSQMPCITVIKSINALALVDSLTVANLFRFALLWLRRLRLQPVWVLTAGSRCRLSVYTWFWRRFVLGGRSPGLGFPFFFYRWYRWRRLGLIALKFWIPFPEHLTGEHCVISWFECTNRSSILIRIVDIIQLAYELIDSIVRKAGALGVVFCDTKALERKGGEVWSRNWFSGWQVNKIW